MSEMAIPQDRRLRTRELVEQMLAERSHVLALLCRAGGLEPFQEKQPVQSLLKEFCELLVDYIAVGHFGLYERIGEGRERRQEVRKLAEELYPAISNTTESVVDFNSKYEEGGSVVADELSDDLSRLGEQLATRIDLEDRLIERLQA